MSFCRCMKITDKDIRSAIERIIFLEGHPNLQKLMAGGPLGQVLLQKFRITVTPL